jgi:hypothetical protein
VGYDASGNRKVVSIQPMAHPLNTRRKKMNTYREIPPKVEALEWRGDNIKDFLGVGIIVGQKIEYNGDESTLTFQCFDVIYTLKEHEFFVLGPDTQGKIMKSGKFHRTYEFEPKTCAYGAADAMLAERERGEKK